MANPTVNSQVVVERLPAVQGFPNQRFNVIVNGDGTFSLFLEDRANSDFNSNAGAISATGLPLEAGSVSTGITGTGTANTVAKFTAAQVIGNSLITDDGTNIAASPPGTFTVNGKQLIVAGGTTAVSQPAISVTQTWNAGAVTFTGIKLNVTDTASGANSLLIDLQTGGITQFSVDKAGAVVANSLVSANLYFITQLASFVFGTSLKSPANGVFTVLNAGATDFDRFQFGGTTSAFPAIKRNSTAVEIRLADDSAAGDFICGGIVNAGPGNNFSIGKTSVGSKFEVFMNAAQTAAFSFRTNDFVLGASGTSIDGGFTTSTVAGSSTPAVSMQVFANGALAAGILQLNPTGGVEIFTTSTFGGRILAVGGNASFGAGDGTATPSAAGVCGASAIGTDKAGANLNIIGGQSTGTGLGGSVVVQLANKQGTGATSNNLGTVFTIAPPNTGTTAPANGLTLTSAIAGGTPTLAATGSDAAINFNIAGKGTGNVNLASNIATPAAGSVSARVLLGTTAGFGIYYGSGAPTVSAAQGSLYLRSDGTGVNDRAYINTNGSTTWTPIVTVA